MEVKTPEGRRLGKIGSLTYKMGESAGTREAKVIENKLFLDAAVNIRKKSQQYSDRPGISTIMKPNLDLITRLMDNRRDAKNARSLYEPKHKIYIAEALAEQHYKCKSLLMYTHQSKPALCDTCYGCFYVEHGVGYKTVLEKVNDQAEQHQDQEQDEAEAQQKQEQLHQVLEAAQKRKRQRQQMLEEARRLERERSQNQQEQKALSQQHRDEQLKTEKLKRKMETQKRKMLENDKKMAQMLEDDRKRVLKQSKEMERLRQRRAKLARDQANVQGQVNEEDQAGDELNAQGDHDDQDHQEENP